ncbi:MAG: carboxylesterase family protein [Actinophytocola sp.]|nr:carboxylesterase family protein [Actinophytocola sp.]
MAAGLVTASAASSAAAAAPSADVVRTGSGLVRGTSEGPLRLFQGIPFARPPVGSLRWQAPRPVRPWGGVYDATFPRSQCAQIAPAYGGSTTYGEDCLYLNVTAPTRRHGRLPVMVWLHGGSNLTGSGSAYDAAALAGEGDVVVVTVNYRLGVFGWLAHPSFGSGTGNYGLLDQQAALRWVRRNAAAFGGDPRNVTLFGESAGAADTCASLVSPTAAGLFHKAVMQSYSCAFPARTMPAAEADAASVAAAVGCADAGCLRGVSAKTLLERFAALGAAAGPVVGDRVLPRQPADAIARGRFNRMPVMHGNTLDEMRLYVALFYPQPITEEQYDDIVLATYGPAVLTRYPAASYPEPRIALATIQTDYGGPLSTCTHLDAYRLLAERVPVYAYQFADREAPPLIDAPGFDEGAEHATELTFLWPNLLGSLTEPQERLSDRMVRYWTTFAHDGRPAGWPRFRDADDVLSLSPDRIRPVDIAEQSNCAFWSELTG